MSDNDYLLHYTIGRLHEKEEENQALRMDNFILKCLSGSLALFSFALTFALLAG